MVTDLFGTGQSFNVPGAMTDLNWSERIERPVREWGSSLALSSPLSLTSAWGAELW